MNMRWAALASVVVVVLAGAGIWLALDADRGTAVPPDPIIAFPGPGWHTASSETQISLRGLPASQLGQVEVEGSESGDHAGQLEPHSDGRGASFVPDEPFEAGEQVTVRTDLTVAGTRDGDFSFTVARPATAPEPIVEPPRGNGDVQHFRTRPDLTPPAVSVTTSDGAGPGDIFLAPKRGKGQDGLMILDGRGKLVWWRAMQPDGKQATDFRAQRYGGRPVLTWWEGGTNIGVGYGEGVILDQSYREVLRVRAGNGYRAGLHEFLLTPRGTALMIMYSFVQADLSPIGGPEDGSVLDGVMQEIDLQTGLVLFEWHTMDHIALQESMWSRRQQPGFAYDFVHMNSIAIDRDGDLLISGRHTWAVYKVDRETGSIIWRLGGKRSDFEMGAGAEFAFQHDVRRREDGAITLFDNGAGPPAVHDASRAIALDVDEEARTAKLVSEVEHPSHGVSENQGNAENMPNGHTFAGWGALPFFTEYARDGHVVLNGRLAEGNDNYRAYRGRWTGRPATRPVAAAERRDGQVVVTASWNGATEVARWELLAGDARDALRPNGGSTPKRGFETPMRAPAGARWLAARAVDARGAVLASTEPVRAP